MSGANQRFLIPLHHQTGLMVSDARMKAAHLVADDHVEGGGRCHFLDETAHIAQGWSARETAKTPGYGVHLQTLPCIQRGPYLPGGSAAYYISLS
jgi:hypothetical protein